MSKPQLIDDQEHERVFERVAAVDVAKASGMVCTRGPHPSRPGARQAAVWDVPATMNAVSALADQLVAAGVSEGDAGVRLRLLADLGAPRGALPYSPLSGQELEEVFLDLMAYP